MAALVEHRYVVLRRRIAGLTRVKGPGAALLIGYECEATVEGECVVFTYRGKRFAVMTPNSLTVWHDKPNLSTTLQRHINKLLRVTDHSAVIRSGDPYLLEKSTGNLTPFPADKPVTITTSPKGTTA